MPQRKRRSRQRRCWLGLVLTLVISLLSAEVLGRERSNQIHMENVPWPWPPQLDLPIPPDFMSGQRIGSTSEQWMALAYVGVPFLIDMYNVSDLMQLTDVVAFMRTTAAGGVCPHHTTRFSTMHYLFHPEELALLYGEKRWFALQRLQCPAAWSLVLKEDVGPVVRAAEVFIEKLEAFDPPGKITVISHRDQATSASPWVPLADFKVVPRTTESRIRRDYRSLQLVADFDATHRRMQIQRLVRSKLRYNEGIRTYDEAVATAQRYVLERLEELRREEQTAYARHTRRKHSYLRFLRERHWRFHAHKNLNHNTTDRDVGRWTRSHGTREMRIQQVPGILPASPLSGRSEVACRKVSAAWNTLCRIGVGNPLERRLAELRRLHVKHRCTEPLQDLPSTSSAAQGKAFLSSAAAAVWREGVAEMTIQRRKSGRSPTFAQMFAVLYHVWKEQKAATQQKYCNPRKSTSLPDEGSSTCREDGEFDADVFVSFVEHWAQTGNAVTAAPNQRLPSWIQAEMHYTLAMLQLARPIYTSSREHSSQASSIAHAVVRLHESLSVGSHHAAGALATLREHGIFIRQQSKVAVSLLLRSTVHASTNLWRELLLRRPRQGFLSATKKELPPPDASRLLRFEHIYAVYHSFRDVDNPFMTRQSAAMLIATTNENVHIGEDSPEMEDVYREAEVERSDEDYQGPLTLRLRRRFFKAKMLFSGFKGVKRDPQEAHCELLVILRHIGYLCDLDVGSFFANGEIKRSRDAPSASPITLMTIIGVALPDSCREHETELFDLLKNKQRTLLSCPGDGARQPRRTQRSLDVPNSKTLFELLLVTLLSLSYVHLIHTHRYDISHMYASLSLGLSLHTARVTTAHLTEIASAGAFSDALVYVSSRNESVTDSFLKSATKVANSNIDAAWCIEFLMEDLEEGFGASAKTHIDSMSGKAALLRKLQRFLSVADSPLVSTESLLLLGVSRWAARGPLSGSAAEPAAFERDLSEWFMEPFGIVQRLLHKTPGRQTAATSRQTQKSPVTADHLKRSLGVGVAFSESVVDVHALFLLCLAAMKRWDVDFPLVHTLDATTYSVRRTDPFVLASFLLRASDPATGAFLISIEKLRDIAFAASPHFLGDAPRLLPLVDDTVDSYAVRLLRFAAQHIHALEPSVELLRRDGYGVPTTTGKTGTPAELTERNLRRASLDDGPPSKSRLRTLRKVKQQVMENADLQTLLYAADVHDYMNHSRWTSTGAFLNVLYNAVIYPFTTSMTEGLVLDMETQLEFLTPQERVAVADKRGHTDLNGTFSRQAPEGTAVTAFVEAFANDSALRELFIAGHLLSAALESGMPQGFSLILLEVTKRGNRFLSRFAKHMAESVFGQLAPSVWTEHHLSAQWHREKVLLVEEGTTFVLDTRSPFFYASVEARQELFARVSRWNAVKAEQEETCDARHPKECQQTRVSRALDELLWCAGLLTRRVYKDTHRVYPYAFEGSAFPAADLECVEEMNRLLGVQLSTRKPGLATTDTPTRSAAELRRMLQNGTSLLLDLSERLGHVYGILSNAPARRFPPSEADFSANVRETWSNTPTQKFDDKLPSRFSRTSTQLVEPWHRISKDHSEKVVAYGEGFFYNQRLHRVTGFRWGASLKLLWLRLRSLWPW